MEWKVPLRKIARIPRQESRGRMERGERFRASIQGDLCKQWVIRKDKSGVYINIEGVLVPH